MSRTNRTNRTNRTRRLSSLLSPTRRASMRYVLAEDDVTANIAAAHKMLPSHENSSLHFMEVSSSFCRRIKDAMLDHQVYLVLSVKIGFKAMRPFDISLGRKKALRLELVECALRSKVTLCKDDCSEAIDNPRAASFPTSS
mmetsp:Transcript_32779/g.60961  ORF Transcript_32779/g.60961 Transcript_32779/m.60961 type:complete len:141 (-) Transcript_32779:499-921(-)